MGIKNQNANLSDYGVHPNQTVNWNLSPEELVEKALDMNEGTIASNGAITINTGEFRGRSPQDRFVVKDDITANTVDWNDINMPFESDAFDKLYDKVAGHLSNKTLFVHDGYACADETYKLNIRVVAEKPWSANFANNMFLRLTDEQKATFDPEWVILCAPTFMANAAEDKTRQHNFAIINFTRKRIIIGGTGYTGEIKKGIFSVLNYILPMQNDVLSMHCSANLGKGGDTAIFFGLSGTGKTTLSADAERGLIGDDEHGWSDNGVFNFEGGSYAKTINLSQENEPEIFAAIKKGAILENIVFKEGTNEPDYDDTHFTQNTRVSYPIDHIANALPKSVGGHPKNVFFLTYDAFGVLPPISRLDAGQAMYHFISGYTSKVAGTEAGITEPKTVFSACFGAPFLPLHPTQYADMLGDKLREHGSKVWLINTGLSGGPYGIGDRVKLKYTRRMVSAALNGELNDVEFVKDSIFGLSIPTSIEGVPDNILQPADTWSDQGAYKAKAQQLAQAFVKNFEKFADRASEEIMAAAPKVSIEA